jgi:protein-S-isoprenylcysteine O-methyltransferase Ste14
MVAQTLGFILLVAVVLFGAAGRIDIPLFWAYLGVLAAVSVFAAGLALFIWAMHVNRFFSSAVRIQQERGHQVVTAGPYRWVRHPGYAGAIPAIVASGIALCSWLAAALGALGVPLLLWRTIIEDRTLRAELPGYTEYAQQVRWRLFPGLW